MNPPEPTMQFLKAVPYFAGLNVTVLATVADRCRAKVLREGQFVFVEEDPCRALYILESGRVKFYRASAEGREQTLKLFDRPGEHPSMGLKLVATAGEHMRSLVTLAEDLSLKTVTAQSVWLTGT